jgi:hypothetical protein
VAVRIENRQQLVAAVSERLAQDAALRQDVAEAFTKILDDLESGPVTIVSFTTDPNVVEVAQADNLYELLGVQPSEEDTQWMAEKIRTDPQFREWAAEDIAYALNPIYPYVTDHDAFATAIRAALVTIAQSWGVEL